MLQKSSRRAATLLPCCWSASSSISSGVINSNITVNCNWKNNVENYQYRFYNNYLAKLNRLSELSNNKKQFKNRDREQEPTFTESPQQEEKKDITTESYTKILKKFFLKVHPDFFQQDPTKQQQNKESFSKLNELLNWTNEYSQLTLDNKNLNEEELSDLEKRLNRLGPIPSVDESFVFFVKETGKQKSEAFRIEVLFSLPKKVQFNGKLKSRLVLTQRLEELVTSLLEKSKIITAEEAKSRRDFAMEQYREMEESMGTNGKKTYKSLKEELRMALQNNLQGAVNLEKLRRGEQDDEDWWWDKDLPSIEHLVTHGMLFFSKNITAEQTIKAMNQLKNGLSEMRYYEWSDIPLMITEKTGKYAVNDPVDGFICIPYDFTPFDFIKEVLNNQKNMMLLVEKRELTRKKAEAIQNIRERLIEEVGLSDLSISPELTSEELYTFIENFEKRYLSNDKMKLLLKDLCIIIDNKYSASPDGYISIHWNFMHNDKDNMFEFLKDLGAQKIKNIKDMGRTLGKLKNSCVSLGEELIDKLKCKELNLTTYADVNESNMRRYQSLPVTNEYMKRLRECCLFLERYDWSTYTFYMVNTLDLPKGFKLPLKQVPHIKTEADVKHLMRRLTVYGDTIIDMGDRAVYIPINFNENQLFETVNRYWKMIDKPQLQLDGDDFTDVVDPQGFQQYRNLASELVKQAEFMLTKKRAERYQQLAEFLNSLEDQQLYGKGASTIMEAALDSQEDERYINLYRTWFRIRDIPLDVFETQ